MMIVRYGLIAGALVLAMFVVAWPVAAFEPVYADGENVAIGGYDTVAYFTEGRPVHGDPSFEHVWQDARWRFSSAENRDQFAGEPERYAPRYGGFCAGAMARGRLFRADPEAWKIIDGKLYLNFWKPGAERFALDAGERIPKADANWEILKANQ